MYIVSFSKICWLNLRKTPLNSANALRKISGSIPSFKPIAKAAIAFSTLCFPGIGSLKSFIVCLGVIKSNLKLPLTI